MAKYYIEIYSKETNDYILQSQFFNTSKEATQWAKQISFLDDEFRACLMIAEWNEENETYGDIEFIKIIRI